MEVSTEQKPKLNLVKGDSLIILCAARKAARKANWSEQDIQCFLYEATGSDYDNLIRTCMKYFDIVLG